MFSIFDLEIFEECYYLYDPIGEDDPVRYIDRINNWPILH